VLGTSQLRLGQLREAKRCLEESLRLAPARSDPRHSAAIISSLALIEKAQGNYDAAMRLSLEALAHHRRLGDVGSEALSLNNLAALHIERQEFEIAGEYLRPALVLCDRLGLVVTRVFVLSNLIGVSDHTGQPDAAESYARLALEQAQAIGNRFVVSYVKMQNAKFALRRHDLTAARAALREAMDIAIAIARPALLIEGMTRFGEILAAQGAPDCGRAVMTFALEHPDTAATERDELRRVLARMPAFSGSPLRWPGMTLDELAHRIVIEADVAHAPLIAALRGAD
jgi:tetratricopeptide (TPR) repeat protein